MSEEIFLHVERLEGMLTLRKWGPGELAYHSGVDYDTIYKIRTKQRTRISAEIVAKLSLALKCTMEYLMGIAPSPSALGVELPPCGPEMLDVLQVLPPERGADLLYIGQRMVQAQHELNRQMLQVMLGALRSAVAVEDRAVLAEALRLSDAGNVPGALAFIEGYFVRREAEEAEEEPAHDG